MRSVSLAHAALPFASLLFVVPLGGCRSLGGAGKTSQPAADGTVAEGATATTPMMMGGPRTRAEARLDNGVRVIVEENHAAPVVAVQVWVASGAADDPPALAGAAHLYEHLVFRGTRRRAPGAGEREIEAAGGTVSAWTGLDETVYQATVAAPFLDVGLDVLADALTAPTFDAAELARDEEVGGRRDRPRRDRSGPRGERAAARGRLRRRRPRPAAARQAGGGGGAHARGAGGPFRRDLPGREHDRRRGGRRRRAQPRARPWRARSRPFRAGVLPVHAVAAANPSSGPRALLSTASGLEAQVALGFRVAAPRPEDAAALDLIAALLTRGSDARLARELARQPAGRHRRARADLSGARRRAARADAGAGAAADRGGRPGGDRRGPAARARPGPGRRARPRPGPPAERSRPRRRRRRGAGAAARVRLRHRGRRRRRPSLPREPGGDRSAGAARGRGQAAAARGPHAGRPRSGRRSRRSFGRVGPVGGDRRRRGGAERQAAPGRGGGPGGGRGRCRPRGRPVGGAHPRAARSGRADGGRRGGLGRRGPGGGRRVERRRRADRGAARSRDAHPRGAADRGRGAGPRRDAGRLLRSQPLRAARAVLARHLVAGRRAPGRLPAAPELPGGRGRRQPARRGRSGARRRRRSGGGGPASVSRGALARPSLSARSAGERRFAGGARARPPPRSLPPSLSGFTSGRLGGRRRRSGRRSWRP